MDHVVDGENGFLFEPDDLAGMIGCSQRLVSEPGYMRQLGANARAYAELDGNPGWLARRLCVVAQRPDELPSLAERTAAYGFQGRPAGYTVRLKGLFHALLTP